MLNANTGVMDSGLIASRCPGMTSALDFRATLNQTRRKDRALPQIGRDVVKIRGMDGIAYIFVVRGTSALVHAKQGIADERHTI
jgi:hypothetical protein